MAKVELVIKIPEEVYKASQIIDVKYEDVIQIPLEVIANATLLPKGHGRLIILSEDKLKENQTDFSFYFQKWVSEVGISNATVAIIEAEREEVKK